MKKARDIAEVLSLATLDGLPPDDALQAIAQLVDHALDQGDLSLTLRALNWCEQTESRLTSDGQRILLDYFRANAWAHRQGTRHSDRSAAWAWDQEELQQQVFFLRRARNSPAFDELPLLRRCQILTNLANQLDTVGRFIEARMLWSKALRENPKFWMARANRGRGLMHYAQALYDPGHAAVFAFEAHKDLAEALQHIDEHPELGDPGLRTYFADAAQGIERHFDLDRIAADYRPDQFELGDGEDERRYRKWCLRETLFLNPLNDLGPNSIAARDVLTLPDFVTAVGEPPVLVGFFNQLKQEFVSARWLYFEGIKAEAVHLSDRDVLLYNTLDYASLGLGVEQVKIAFRMSYSLLDKIAFFLNHYMKLGIPEKRITFRHVWRDKESGPVRAEFSNSENWPFRGLYWLSKDLVEKDFKDVTESEARDLHDLRNHLEHKHVKVHSMIVPTGPAAGSARDPFLDNLAHSVSRDDLERRGLHILKLARAALIYLSLGMHKEECGRRERAGPDSILAEISLTEMEDEWKRRW
ncbi:MAG TPA: LA2681 family HEPN domain-containing protein [Burkholderiaceae bacterium]|nr:LA2681 family HEPN domain-containing protein [Burkholderiaceae bacterium]